MQAGRSIARQRSIRCVQPARFTLRNRVALQVVSCLTQVLRAVLQQPYTTIAGMTQDSSNTLSTRDGSWTASVVMVNGKCAFVVALFTRDSTDCALPTLLLKQGIVLIQGDAVLLQVLIVPVLTIFSSALAPLLLSSLVETRIVSTCLTLVALLAVEATTVLALLILVEVFQRLGCATALA